MGRVLDEGGRDGGEGLGLGLQDGPAAAFDLLCAVGQAAEERPYLLADLGLGAKQVLAVTSSRTQPQIASSAL